MSHVKALSIGTLLLVAPRVVTTRAPTCAAQHSTLPRRHTPPRPALLLVLPSLHSEKWSDGAWPSLARGRGATWEIQNTLPHFILT